MMMKGLVMGTVLAASVLCADAGEAQQEPKKQNLAEQLGMQQLVFKNTENKTLPYCQAVEGKDLPGRYSIVIFFHGAGERGDNNSAQLIHGIPQLLNYVRKNKEKTVILAPQCPNGQQWVNTPWSGKSHTLPEKPSAAMTLATQLLDSKIKEFDVNPDRVYVTGISMGGYATWDILSRRPEQFAAAIPVCGGADTAYAEKMKRIPIQIFHGDSDTAVPTSRSADMYQALKKAGNKKVDYHEIYQCGHNAWSPAYNDSITWSWLFGQRKNAPMKLFFW